jgi:hypothetical protein
MCASRGSPPTRARSRRAISSSRSRASASTGTISSKPRGKRAQSPRSSRSTGHALPGNLIAVPDPLHALGVLAALARRVCASGHRNRRQQQDDGREMLARPVLRAHFGGARVLATEGNLNNAACR